jgi:hypothetical protein
MSVGGLGALRLHLLVGSILVGAPRIVATADAKLIDALVGRYRKGSGRQAPDRSTATSRRKGRICCGWPTSPTFQPGSAFSIWQLCWMRAAVGSSAG